VVDFLESLPRLAQLLILLGRSPSSSRFLTAGTLFNFHGKLLSDTYGDQGNRQPHTKNRKASDHRRQVHNLAQFIPG
jgi:hypothetical protein